jgi:predicted aspartyl protease
MKTKAIICGLFIATVLLLSHSIVQGQNPQGERRHVIVSEMKPLKVHFPAGEDFVEVPFEDDRNHMLIPIRVNGSDPLKFVFDTGLSGAILFNSAIADSQKLNIVGKDHVRGAGNGGDTEISIANGITFDIGGIKLSDGEMGVLPPVPARPQMGRNTDGGIGLPVYASLVVEVDWERHIIKFYDPAKYTYSGKGAIIPLTFDEGGRPYTPATVITSDNAKVPVKLVVDTGASAPLSLDIGSNPNIKAPEGAVKVVLGQGGNGQITGYAGRIKSLQLGDYKVNNVLTDFPDESQGTAGIGGRQGRLGAGVLKRFKIIYDYSRKRMILEPNKFLDDPF